MMPHKLSLLLKRCRVYDQTSRQQHAIMSLLPSFHSLNSNHSMVAQTMIGLVQEDWRHSVILITESI